MQLLLDPETIRSLIALRRAATDMKLPMNERMKLHFITRRGDLLSNFSLTAAAWMILLHTCSATPGDEAALQQLKQEVVEFKDWADEGLQALQRMGLQEAISDGGDDCLPDDPQLVAALRKMMDEAPRPKGPDSH